MLSVTLTYLIVINLMAFLMFRWDKQSAIEGARRASEDALMFVALAGGSVGAKFAQQKFRHKLTKQPFAILLNFVLLTHVVIGAWLLSLAF